VNIATSQKTNSIIFFLYSGKMYGGNGGEDKPFGVSGGGEEKEG
jgi:hypothetical protein